MHGAIAEAGVIRLERIRTIEGRPKGLDTGMYPAIQFSLHDTGEIAYAVHSYTNSYSCWRGSHPLINLNLYFPCISVCFRG